MPYITHFQKETQQQISELSDTADIVVYLLVGVFILKLVVSLSLRGETRTWSLRIVDEAHRLVFGTVFIWAVLVIVNILHRLPI